MSATCPHGITLRSGCYQCNPEFRERDEKARIAWERRGELVVGITEADTLAEKSGLRLIIERLPDGSWYVALGHRADGAEVIDYQHASLQLAVRAVAERYRERGGG